ncbi:hypothetical protein [Nocardia alni]|uniref:hypothetical protein n=1 Tax=Nocardia alni TaxID=2815723 RepID=UPI001C224505|nr:hypothetical protein [Nocardia alni]
MRHFVVRPAVAICGVTAVLAAVVGCSSSSHSSAGASTTSVAASSSAPAAAATAAPSSDPTVQAVTNTFVTFFNGKTPVNQKVALVENGSAFAPALQAQANSPTSAQTTATVSNVKLTDPTHAAVTYSILIGGSPALPNQDGQAVNDGGQWKVAVSTFCALMAMQSGGGAAPGCPAH